MTVGLLPIGLRPNRTDYVCDTCYLQLTGRFFAEGQAVTRCLVGHDLPEPTGRPRWVACPTCERTASVLIGKVEQLSLFEGV